MSDTQTGIVKAYDEDEGHGTINRDEGGDIYFHYTSIRCDATECSLEEGNKVSFRIVDGPKGLQAQDVIVLDPEE